MSVETIIAIIAGIMAFVGTVAGGAWWMSALYAEVKGIHHAIDAMAADNKEDRKIVWGKLDNHERRLTTLEAK